MNLKELKEPQYIKVDPEARTISLEAKHSTYQLKIDANKSVLHTWYGAKSDGTDFSYLIDLTDHGFSGNPSDRRENRNYSFDTLPQEYPQLGTGDFRIKALDILWENGSRASDFRYFDHKIYQGKYALEKQPAFFTNELKEAETLELILKDRHSELYLVLLYAVFPEYDLITRASKLINKTKETIYILKQASAALDFQRKDFDLIHFTGRHNMEREATVTSLDRGIFSISSTRGTSSHQHNPSAILKAKDTTETNGECYALALVYSGGFNMDFEVDQLGQTRAVLGLDAANFKWKLSEDQSFTSPEAIFSYSDQGLETLSHNLHTAINKNLIRSKCKDKRRPVLINNWEATYFDFNKDKLLEIAETAKELGFDLFVLDDGWFGNRDNDDKALGDWFENQDKLGGSLDELIAAINEIGLDFGLWFEPEAINEDSELYRKHPDWAISIPNREPNYSRDQLVLDFIREDVREYIKSRFKAIVEDSNIKYIKWDMNRSLSDLYSHALSADRQGEFSHRYVLAVYDVLEYLLSLKEDLFIEGCSGGGGRFDLGMLYYTPQIWTSDNSDAIARTKIQHGTSFIYPISSIAAHVSAVPNHQNQRLTPLKTRGLVAMQGAFGYELDLSKLSAAEKEEAKAQIKFYKEHWELFQKGNYYRTLNPQEEEYLTAFQYASKDQSKALLIAVYLDLESAAITNVLKFRGLEPEAEYRLSSFGRDLGVFKGSALMNAGIQIDRAKQIYDSYYYLAERI